MCGDIFFSAVSHHMINLDIYKTGDGTKQDWVNILILYRKCQIMTKALEFDGSVLGVIFVQNLNTVLRASRLS